jgi:hypothetical protein
MRYTLYVPEKGGAPVLPVEQPRLRLRRRGKKVRRA